MQINLPHDIELEALCLSAVMCSVNAANAAYGFLNEQDFFDSNLKIVYKLFKEVYESGQECNLHSMICALKKPIGNVDRNYICNIDGRAWGGVDFDYYFKQLKNFSSLRGAINVGKDLIFESCKQSANFEMVIADHQTKLLGTMGSLKDTVLPKEIIENFRDDKNIFDYSLWRRDRFRKGLPTWNGVISGYNKLDNTLGGFQNGGLYYIGARTSMGKTTFLLNLINKMVIKYRVGFFSLEMSSETIVEKLMTNMADLKYNKFVSGNFSDEELERMRSLAPFYAKDNLFIEDEQSLTISKISARAKRLKNNYNIDILFIDYLTLIKNNQQHTTKHMQVDEVSKGLQALGKSLNIPIVCLAQLNRSAVSENGNRPTMSQFRESGSIEEDADACILLHRPEYYNKNEKPGMIEIIIAKNRIMGTLETINFTCNSQVSDRYHEATDIQEQIKKDDAKQYERQFNAQFKT